MPVSVAQPPPAHHVVPAPGGVSDAAKPLYELGPEPPLIAFACVHFEPQKVLGASTERPGERSPIVNAPFAR